MTKAEFEERDWGRVTEIRRLLDEVIFLCGHLSEKRPALGVVSVAYNLALSGLLAKQEACHQLLKERLSDAEKWGRQKPRFIRTAREECLVSLAALNLTRMEHETNQCHLVKVASNN